MKNSNEITKTTPKSSRIIIMVSRNIRYYRLKNKISQEYLAELSSLHRNYIGQVERGEVNLSLINLEQIAKSLNVNPIDLLEKNSEVDYHE